MNEIAARAPQRALPGIGHVAAVEVASAVADEIGAGRTGIRISPGTHLMTSQKTMFTPFTAL
jgi:hypothetical protein